MKVAGANDFNIPSLATEKVGFGESLFLFLSFERLKGNFDFESYIREYFLSILDSQYSISEFFARRGTYSHLGATFGSDNILGKTLLKDGHGLIEIIRFQVK